MDEQITKAQLRILAAGLAYFGRHQAPCPHWTTAEADEPCTCDLHRLLKDAVAWAK